jgi:hypothetical protein
MRGTLPPCPKCTGQLFLEPDTEWRLDPRPEAVCLQCGWRRGVILRAAHPEHTATRRGIPIGA